MFYKITIRALIGIICISVIIITILLVNTVLNRTKQIMSNTEPDIQLDTGAAVRHFSKALTYKTVSHSYPKNEYQQELRAFHKYLQESYPLVHSRLQKEVIADYSLLYVWKGSDTSLKPILFSGHLDVAAAEPESDWKYPPFKGNVANGFIWGRGAADDKLTVIGLMEAVEYLLKQNFQPKRTLYFAFGHDEEIAGSEGAASIAGLLLSRGIKFDYQIDEGGVILASGIPGLSKPVAFIMIAEKGYLELELTAEGKIGHTSEPPAQTAIGILASAVAKIENNQLPPRLAGAANRMFEYLGPEMPFPDKLFLSNLWAFRPLLEKTLVKAPTENALVRTTYATTTFNGGENSRLLPKTARAVMNVRILSGESVKSVIDRVKGLVGGDRVKVNILGNTSEPSKIADVNAIGYKNISKALSQVYPDIVAIPSLLKARTDTVHYRDIVDNAYRFTPIYLFNEDKGMIHGRNERIKVEYLAKGISFYIHCISNAAK